MRQTTHFFSSSTELDTYLVSPGGLGSQPKYQKQQVTLEIFAVHPKHGTGELVLSIVKNAR